MGGSTFGDFGRTRGSFKKSNSKKDNRFRGKPGEIKRDGYKETYIGNDGRAIKEKHYTDHGNPKHHTNPHEHDIEWDNEGNPIFK